MTHSDLQADIDSLAPSFHKAWINDPLNRKTVAGWLGGDAFDLLDSLIQSATREGSPEVIINWMREQISAQLRLRASSGEVA